MSSTTIVLVLELDRVADCPRGTARRGDEEPRAFHGWLELAGTITALASDSGSDSGWRQQGIPPAHEGETT